MTKYSAWSFDPVHASPDGSVKITYSNLNECAMGGPLIGSITISLPDHEYTPEEYFGGPPVFDEDSTHFAIPVWTKELSQRLVVVDCVNRTMHYLPHEFRVLALSKYENKTVFGVDSPTHDPYPFLSYEKDFIEYEKF